MAQNGTDSGTLLLKVEWLAPRCPVQWAGRQEDVPEIDPSRGWFLRASGHEVDPLARGFALDEEVNANFPRLVRRRIPIDEEDKYTNEASIVSSGELVSDLIRVSRLLSKGKDIKSQLIGVAEKYSPVVYIDKNTEWGDTSLESWISFLNEFKFAHDKIKEFFADTFTTIEDILDYDITIEKRNFFQPNNEKEAEWFFWLSIFRNNAMYGTDKSFSVYKTLVLEKIIRKVGLAVETEMSSLTIHFYPDSVGKIQTALWHKAGIAQRAFWELAQLMLSVGSLRVCETCGTLFPLTRGDKKVCSSACRQKKKRQFKSVTTVSQPHP